MADHWQALTANLAVVALFITTWVHGRFVFARLARWQRKVIFGLAMGLGAVASILLAIPFGDSLFDLRSTLVAIAGFFGGPIAGAVAATIAIAYRAGVVGGPHGITAITGIAAAAVVGWAVSAIVKRRIPPIWRVILLAGAVATVNLGVGLALRGATSLTPLSFQVAAMNSLATALSAFFMMRYRVVERERDLLRQAFLHSPDFQYVKTPDGKFAAVNVTVAAHHGYPSPRGLIGKTDFDLTDGTRATRLAAAEQAVLAGGPPISDEEEEVVTPQGQNVWYLTSKVALHNDEGKVIGLAGVSRDVTVRRRLHGEVEEARNRLGFVLAGVSDGIAMFDRFGVLAYCNEQYREMFAMTREVRQPGRHIHEILRAVASTGEQKGILPGLEQEWVEQVAATLDTSSDQEIQLADGRWMQIKTRPASDGSALVVVSEITKLKLAESALRQMTDQLKLLATTDGLTGLTNRRAFDEALDAEIARGRRSGQPLALVMIDVDRFKSYNDLYGHQAGDEVLKAVGMCLRTALKRPGDVVARYGGEEFVAILPNTDENGAFFIADAFREALRGLGLLHKGGDRGIVTASVGIATLTVDNAIDATALVRRADEALYEAKGAGRDRVMGWRARHDIKRVVS